MKDPCNPPLVLWVEELDAIGPNAGLKTVTLGATVKPPCDACDKVFGGLKVTTGGPGLPPSVDLKTNSVLHCGFVEGFLASAVAAINAALAIALAALFSLSKSVACSPPCVCGLYVTSVTGSMLAEGSSLLLLC